jgi:hypothetical protein
MDIVKRIEGILLRPQEEWLRIKSEPTTTARLFRSYILLLAAIPAVFQLLERVLIEKLPMVGHWPVGRALISAVVSYVLDLATIYVFALVIDELAPTFASVKNMTGALKLAAYSMTPVWLAGVFSIIPRFWAPGIIAGLYGFFLLYLGFDAPLMETPKKRVFGYVALAVVVIIVLNFVSWLIKTAFAVRSM